MDKIRKIIDHLVFNRINIYKTLLINFVYLPFKDACKLPIWVRGKCKIAHLGIGRIILQSKAKTGMIGIGNSDPIRSYHSKSFLDIQGTLKVSAGVILRRGINLSVAPNATVTIEKNVVIGDNATIISWDGIHFMRSTRVGNNLLMMDTDFHYLLNRETMMVQNNHAPIIIGENNWIGGWCVVKKGTQTPTGTIVAGPYSMVGKNYVGKIPEYSILAGSPAKLIKEGVQRVENVETEAMLKDYFKTNDIPFHVPDEIALDTFCTLQ